MKFKSLTMRIWFTFTAIILILVLAISVFYVVAFRYFDENSKMKDLLVAHNALLESNFTEPIRFDRMQNLRGSSSFLYANGEISPLGIGRRNIPPQQDGDRQHVNDTMRHIEEFIVTYAQGDMNAQSFNKSFEGNSLLFVISSTDSGYLISYVPRLYDNRPLMFILVTGLAFIIIGFFVSKTVAKYISKPLGELEKFSRRVAVKDFSTPIKVKNEDEIGRLAVSMNKMQEDLKRAEAEEKQFLQSISHDLKTPVMVIMSHADAIIDGVYIDSAEHTAEIIKDEAMALSRKIKQLLYLNTLDYLLDNQTQEEQVDLAQAVTHTVDRLMPMRTDVQWTCGIENAKITANTEKITVALENILDNAMRYAKGEISVSLKAEDGVHIEIFNDGAQIKEENLDKIFDNMYKDKTGNFGLGLAITKKIITHYGGTVRAENVAGGVCFVIDF